MASNLQVSNTNSQLNHLDENNVNKYFTSVGLEIQAAIPSYEYDTFLEYMPSNCHLQGMDTFNKITEDSVVEYIKSLPTDKSIYDTIPLKVYKCIIQSIITHFTYIINTSFDSGIMPRLCKKELVTPVYKSEGGNTDLGNYRGISILPLLGKCIEYFVNQQLTQYVQCNNLLNCQQFGFRQNSSTTFLMLDFSDKIYNSKEKGQTPAVIFLDIKKAFDTVDHEILLQKLKHYGLSGTVLNWFKSYLSGRYRCTRLGN